jgi:hypothetical protein
MRNVRLQERVQRNLLTVEKDILVADIVAIVHKDERIPLFSRQNQ